MTKIKIYTEEQVKQIQQAILCNHKDAIMDDNYCLNVTKPIELPSDEEMEKENPFVFGSHVLGTRDLLIWEEGAKWMLDKIQGGNK
jgi:hypothetical protein